MRLWNRRRTLPTDVKTSMTLERGERVLASAQDISAQWLVGTDRSLHLQRARGWIVLPWQRIDRASWDSDSDTVTVHAVADFGHEQPRNERTVPEPGLLLDLLHDRINATVLLTRHVPLEGSRGLRVVARRAPVGDARIEWSFLLDETLDPADPQVVTAVQQGLASARAELGA
ncbi:MAG: hypothetical protein M3419_05860 [Actinomycetota bacterium]|nr:hypothetical protein [Actinomycetota bacterium]